MKKQSKKLMAVVLCLVLLVGVMPITALAVQRVDSGKCGDDATWTLTDDGVLTISGKGDIYDYEIDVPGWLDYFYGIEAIVIQDGITSIGDFTFTGLIGVTEVTIPSSVKEIGAYAFVLCVGLSEVTIPSNVTYIGDSAFESCLRIEKINIPASVTQIGMAAFAECYSLTGFTVDKNNQYYSSDSSGVLFNKDKSILVSGHAGLKNYTIPASVTVIDWFAFSNSCVLTNVTIHENVTDIGIGAFLGAVSLEKVTVAQNNQYFINDERGILFTKDMSVLICVPTATTGSYIIPDGVSYIEYGAFGFCQGLTDVIIPDGVEEIGDVAFISNGITGIEIPASVTYIGVGAFNSCEALVEIKFAGDAPTIEEDSFGGVTATAYYPENNDTWTSDVRNSYGGEITWTAYTPATRPMGDVDGDGEITNADLVKVARYIVDYFEPESEDAILVESYGDIDGDGSITNADLVKIARIIVGLE